MSLVIYFHLLATYVSENNYNQIMIYVFVDDIYDIPMCKWMQIGFIKHQSISPFK